LLRKGENTITQTFGNEGSGAKSKIFYDWKTDTTYGFLVKGEPSKAITSHTAYTAWFRNVDDPQEGWILLASWSRPGGANYLSRWGSFAENFGS